MYRSNSSLTHSDFVPYDDHSAIDKPRHWTPNGYMWTSLNMSTNNDWTFQKLLGSNGDPAKKQGLAIYLFHVSKDMPEHNAFSSLDGDMLIIPQAGALDIQTELGNLLVRQNEIAVIPRGIRHRVTLPAGSTRGYICEVYQGHFRLPDLGVIGSTGLANARDFQIPTAAYSGKLSTTSQTLIPDTADWRTISRLNSRLWTCTQTHTPFDVAAWHGTSYPYKYDLARFCALGNVRFDEHDPSLFTVLTVPSNAARGTAVVDFAVIGPRWQVGEETLWIPYYHRNTMSEFYGPIVHAQDKSRPFNGGKEFRPFACGLNGLMATHGASEAEYARAQEIDTEKPMKQMQDRISIFLLETELPLMLTDWALEGSNMNPKSKVHKAKM